MSYKINCELFLLSFFFVFDSKLNAQSSKLNVYVFLSETCPMSQNYIPVLNKIQETYKDKGVEIVGIFPNFYVTDSIVNQFVKTL